jgi:ABC-2 type transport system ATP-binding protein
MSINNSEIEPIVVENISKEFNGLRAVDGISFKVRRAEVFGFLGPNGAGKTTTVRMLIGVIKPNSGSMWVDGINVQEEPIKVKEKIGVAPEEFNAYADLTGLENLNLTGDFYDIPRRKRIERSFELLRKFNLYEWKDKYAKQYSKGMKHRLLLAMALVNDPPILFFDELTAGLDVASRRIIRNHIKLLSKEGKTIFLTTHNIEEADKLCDRIAIINKGRIAAIDSPEKLKRTISSTQSVVVSFEGKTIYYGLLKGLKVVESVEKRGDKFHIYTSEPNVLIDEMVNLSRRKNVKILSLQTLGPSLEEVFTILTEAR